VQIASTLGLAMHQARWSQPPIRVIFQQLCAEQGCFNLYPRNVFCQRLFCSVKRNLNLLFMDGFSE
jgi:hypothetical protein